MIAPHTDALLVPDTGGIAAENALIAGSSSRTVATECTALVCRLAVEVDAAIVARPSAFE